VEAGAAGVGLGVVFDLAGGAIEVGPFGFEEGEVGHGISVNFRNRVFLKNPVSRLLFKQQGINQSGLGV
jgi:hypothetical protein